MTDDWVIKLPLDPSEIFYSQRHVSQGPTGSVRVCCFKTFALNVSVWDKEVAGVERVLQSVLTVSKKL